MKNLPAVTLVVCSVMLWGAPHAAWAAGYSFPGPAVIPDGGTILPAAGEVPGKEFSQAPDRDAAGTVDPEQVVNWDGAGGTSDAVNFFGGEVQTPSTVEIDAIANHNDPLFDPLLADHAHLIFSVGNGTSPTGSGQITTDNGLTLGSAGDLSYEAPVSGATGIWATAAQIDAMNPPTDVDAVNLWGAEPPGVNTNRYSLVDDANNGLVLGSGISVYCPGCGSLGDAYIVQFGIRDDVAELLGAPTDFGLSDDDIDVDAMILSDTGDENSIFVHGVDEIIFSIRQLEIPGQPGTYYATGSELFVKRSDGSRSFLFHGGHLWDRDWALANLQVGGRQMDINALEAASVPEPAAWVLTVLGLAGLAAAVRRRGGSRALARVRDA